MSSDPRPVAVTPAGAVRGVWRGTSAAFLGIPFAEPPVGALRFAAPAPAAPWTGVRDAAGYGPTPQRRPFAPVTTIPEPSVPGDSTLNVNVFTPAPGDTSARLPVLVWIHGGGYTAGSPASPWYDGAAFNRDGVITVTISYRLGFDGFGWIADAPLNRGVLDMIAALEWVRDSIAAFGGDPAKVTIAGQSAGGGGVLTLLCSPRAQGLFRAAISHSGAIGAQRTGDAEQVGRELAAMAAVQPTVAGWSALDEDRVLDLQNAYAAARDGDPSPYAMARSLLETRGEGDPLPFAPVVDGELVTGTPVQAVAAGVGTTVPLILGSTAHEFAMAGARFATELATTAPAEAAERAGMSQQQAARYVRTHPDEDAAGVIGQIVTDLLFRVPAVTWAGCRAAAGAAATWLYDFRWRSPVTGRAMHCLDLPFAWDCLDAPLVVEAAGAHPPRQLATAMHGAWVRFVRDGDPGWQPVRAGRWPGMVFDTGSAQAEPVYRPELEFAGLPVGA